MSLARSPVAFVSILIAVFALSNASLHSQALPAGKAIRMIVPSSAGGVTDAGARLIARHLALHLPGKPSIVVENMPGANGFSATNYFFNTVAPDGLTIFAGSSSQVMPDIIRGNRAVHFDVTKMPLVGAIQYSGTLLVGSKASLDRLSDLSKPPVIMAGVGDARTGAMIPVWGAAYLGWNMRWVTGYEGTPQLVLAMLKGEADMMNSTGVEGIQQLLASPDRFTVVTQTGVVKRGRLERRDSFPNVPTISELMSAKLGDKLPSAFVSWLETIKLGKYFALPPKTPAPYVEVYRKAFADMTDDPQFKLEAEKVLEPGYVMLAPDAASEIVARMAATSDADLAEENRLMERYGLSTGGAGDKTK